MRSRYFVCSSRGLVNRFLGATASQKCVTINSCTDTARRDCADSPGGLYGDAVVQEQALPYSHTQPPHFVELVVWLQISDPDVHVVPEWILHLRVVPSLSKPLQVVSPPQAVPAPGPPPCPPPGSAQTGTFGMSRAAARRSVQPSVKATGPDQSFHNFFITHLQEKGKQNRLARSRTHDPTGEPGDHEGLPRRVGVEPESPPKDAGLARAFELNANLHLPAWGY